MNTLNDALKPCAHCGCHNPKFTSDAVHHFRHTIKCQDCPMLAEFYSSTRDQAIAAWNTRANTPESSAAQPAMTADLCEILSTVLHFIPKEEAQLSDDIHAMCGKLRAAQPSDATAQPSDSDHARILVKMHEARVDFNQLVELLGFDAKRIRKEDGSVDWSLLEDGMKTKDDVAAQLSGSHHDDKCVDDFAIMMKEKLAIARRKGRSGWEQCRPYDLSAMLREHVEKGDPRDVANFCMFLWHQGEPIAAPPILHLTDARLLSAFNSAESVIDGLHEVRALLANTAQGKPDHIATDAKRFNALRELATMYGGADDIAEEAMANLNLPDEERGPTAEEFNMVADAIAAALAAKKG